MCRSLKTRGLRSAAYCLAFCSGKPVEWNAISASQMGHSSTGAVSSCSSSKKTVRNSTCPADVNDDGRVDGGDLAAVLAAWGRDVPEVELSGDDLIDGQDLAAVLANWGLPCEE